MCTMLGGNLTVVFVYYVIVLYVTFLWPVSAVSYNMFYFTLLILIEYLFMPIIWLIGYHITRQLIAYYKVLIKLLHF